MTFSVVTEPIAMALDDIVRLLAVPKAANANVAAKTTLGLSAKVSGGVAVGLGGVFMIWDIYNLQNEVRTLVNGSEDGSKIMDVVEELERDLQYLIIHLEIRFPNK